ncbi:MAG: 50S ribosomal protein L18a [Candidatus Thorarchaeota archaeon]|nr:50S ribosomal protein L18a [Candidatus Thorarchaeota archaeon]
MSSKIWRATGSYLKNKRSFTFSKELLAEKDTHVREKILSELGSRHRVKRRHIEIAEIKEIKPEEVTNFELRKILGLETEFE